MRDGDDGIAWRNPAGAKSNLQRIGSAADADAPRNPNKSRELRLKFTDFVAKDVPAIFQDSLDRPVNLLLVREITGLGVRWQQHRGRNNGIDFAPHDSRTPGPTINCCSSFLAK